MIDAIAKLVQLFFIFWIHMLWGSAVVFALAYLVFEVIAALIGQS
jgi:hypothetical protein